MFDTLRKVFGFVEIEEKDGIIHVRGVPSYVIQRDIQRLWGTSRIGNNIFRDLSGSSLSFYSFFALEVDYAINRLIEDKTSRASKHTLRSISDLLREHTWLRRIYKPDQIKPRLDRSGLSNLKIKPLPVQERFFEDYERAITQLGLRGTLLAGAPGSGKTPMGLMLAEMLRAEIVFIVCPKNAVYDVWVQNIEDHYKKAQSMWVAGRDNAYKGQRFVIGHYEALEKMIALVSLVKGKDTLIILDESHFLNEDGALRTQQFLRLCDLVEEYNVVWASGTPIKAMGTEVIPLFRSIDPLFIAEVIQAFKNIFGKEANRGLDILSHRLGQTMTVIEKHELGLEKPHIEEFKVKIPNGKEYTLDAIRVKMTDYIEERVQYYKARRKDDEDIFWSALKIFEQLDKDRHYKEYLEYRTNLQILMGTKNYRGLGDQMAACNRFENTVIIPTLPGYAKSGFKEVRAIVKYTPLVIRGECLGRVLGRLRIECITDMAAYVDYVGVIESTEKKTVVFTTYVDALTRAMHHMKTVGLKPTAVYAKTNHELPKILKEFREDPRVNPLVATFDSLSTAVPLIMADTMIMLNVPFRSYVFDQTVSRINRLGATTKATVWIAVLDTGEQPNISQRSLDIMKWSQDQVSAIMGIQAPFEIQNADDEDKAEQSIGLESYTPFEGVFFPPEHTLVV